MPVDMDWSGHHSLPRKMGISAVLNSTPHSDKPRADCRQPGTLFLLRCFLALFRRERQNIVRVEFNGQLGEVFEILTTYLKIEGICVHAILFLRMKQTTIMNIIAKKAGLHINRMIRSACGCSPDAHQGGKFALNSLPPPKYTKPLQIEYQPSVPEHLTHLESKIPGRGTSARDSTILNPVLRKLGNAVLRSGCDG